MLRTMIRTRRGGAFSTARRFQNGAPADWNSDLTGESNRFQSPKMKPRMKSRDVVSLTPSARKKLSDTLVVQDKKRAIFYVVGGGCNGLKYQLEVLEGSPSTGDETISLDSGKELSVCGKSLLHILGTEIDWREDFMGESYRFKNPNVEASCGCGATFTPKDMI